MPNSARRLPPPVDRAYVASLRIRSAISLRSTSLRILPEGVRGSASAVNACVQRLLQSADRESLLNGTMGGEGEFVRPTSYELAVKMFSADVGVRHRLHSTFASRAAL